MPISDQTLKLVLYSSGIVIAPFAAIHLFGHALASVPPYMKYYPFSTANQWMIAARELYQAPVIEALGAIALLSHSSVGIYRYTIRRRFKVGAVTWSVSYWARLSGLFLSSVMGAHVYYTRISPLLVFGDSNIIDYSYMTHVFRHHSPLFVFFYLVFGGAGVIHSSIGVSTVWEQLIRSRPLARLSKLHFWLNVAGVSGVSLGILSLAGYFFPVHVVAGNLFDRIL